MSKERVDSMGKGTQEFFSEEGVGGPLQYGVPAPGFSAVLSVS